MTVDEKRAAGLLGKSVGGRKAEAGAAASRLRREEWFGCTRRDIRRHAASRIVDREDDMRGEAQTLVAELAFFVANRDAHAAFASLHRITRVEHKIEQ